MDTVHRFITSALITMKNICSLFIAIIFIASSGILVSQNGSAIRFNASTSEVIIPFSADFNFTTDFTIEAWIYTTEHPSPVHTVIEKFDNVYGLYILQTGEANGWVTSDSGYAEATSSVIVPVYEWHHVAMTFDAGAALMRVWVDGKPKATAGIFPKKPLAKSNGDIIIGGKTSSGDRFYGFIDEVRFSKIVRYTAEFDPKTIPNNDINCIALYHFDEGSGNTSADASGKNHPATLVDVQWASIPVGVHPTTEIPAASSLAQNYPNPFTSSTFIETEINQSKLTTASLKVYDLFGREILDLSNRLAAEKSGIKISSSQFPQSGLYFYILQTEKKKEVRSLTVLK